jgi:hypothetical protein
MLGQLIAQQRNIVFFLTTIPTETHMSQQSKESLEQAHQELGAAKRRLENAQQHAKEAGAGDLATKIQTVRTTTEKILEDSKKRME